MLVVSFDRGRLPSRCTRAALITQLLLLARLLTAFKAHSYILNLDKGIVMRAQVSLARSISPKQST